MERVVNGKNMIHTFKHWTSPACQKYDGGRPFVADIKGSPLFELTSVKISWTHSRPRPVVSICGHILLIDHLGNEFSLFHRDYYNPLMISLDNTGTTTTLQKCHLESPRCLPGRFCLVFYLLDRHDDSHTLIVDNVIESSTGSFDCVKPILHRSDNLDGKCSIIAEYIVFQCALLASVGLIVEEIETDNDNGVEYAEFSDTISATYKVKDGSCIKHVLQTGCSSYKLGHYVHLSTFGVPAYSLLDIHRDSSFDLELPTRSSHVDFNPYHHSNNIPYEKEMKDHNFRIRVLVNWGHAFYHLPEYEASEWRDLKRGGTILTLNWEEDKEDILNAKRLIKYGKKKFRDLNEDKFNPVCIRPRLAALRDRKWIVSSCPQVLVELFTISVHSYGSDLVRYLSGTVEIYDSIKRSMMIFNKKRPHYLGGSEIIPLKSIGRCYYGSHFGMKLDLKYLEGLEISNGYVGYTFRSVEKWNNIRLCSIIKGKDGFAAVHYTIFADAIQSKLKFRVVSNFSDSVCCKIYGRIYARYGNYSYSTIYSEKFYQSKLFDRYNISDGVSTSSGKIPLSKSVVAVPLNGSLIVMAHISVVTEGGLERLEYSYEATQEGTKSLSNKTKESKFSLSMSVEWGQQWS